MHRLAILSFLLFSVFQSVNAGISLVSFDAKTAENENSGMLSVSLSWTTASETENEYFVIERSADNRLFEVVSRTIGAGNSGQPVSYSIMDRSPVEGKSYYRLGCSDKEGHVSYLGTVEVLVGGPSPLVITNMYPNPAQSFFSIDLMIEDKETQDIWIDLYSSSGKKVFPSQNVAGLSGSFSWTYDVDGLRTGMYFVKIHSASSYVVKVILVE